MWSVQWSVYTKVFKHHCMCFRLSSNCSMGGFYFFIPCHSSKSNPPGGSRHWLAATPSCIGRRRHSVSGFSYFREVAEPTSIDGDTALHAGPCSWQVRLDSRTARVASMPYLLFLFNAAVMRAIHRFALSVDRIALLDDRSFAQPSALTTVSLRRSHVALARDIDTTEILEQMLHTWKK